MNAHPLFLAQIEALVRQVKSLNQKDPVAYVKKNASKRLAAITKLTFDVIPQDPTRPEYHLFFRYHAPGKVSDFSK